jgi:uncharacterized membrane protein
MFGYQISFGSPWYLLLLLLLPGLWWYSHRKLALLGRIRRLLVIGLRTLVLVIVVLALAEIQMVRTTDHVTVIYLLDQSESIPESYRRAMIAYVNGEVRKHRREGDYAGVVVFGRDAAIEIPPFNDPDVGMAPQVESELQKDFTNLAGAMKLAQATFPEDAAKRIVVVTDGNENLGDAMEQLQGLEAAGIGVDVVPIRYQSRAEVVVERVTVPDNIRRGQPFDLRVVVNNTTDPAAAAAGQIRGKLRISQIVDGQPVVLSEQPVTLPPGKKVYSIQQTIDAPSFYTYEARFVPDRPEDDTMPENNTATAFTHVRGKGQVLILENADTEKQGRFGFLVERLRQQGLDVKVRKSDSFTSLAELQQFDTVILGDVPRDQFSDAQIAMLVRNTQQMGSGLIMFGGEDSFGAGGWTRTEMEEAMPVNFQIKAAKVVPRGALVMLMHACEIAEGNHWQKVIAQEALKALGDNDYCGLIHWNGTEQWMWGKGLLPVGPNRPQMLRKIDLMTPGDMPDFDPSLRMAAAAYQAVPDAAVRHMIVISDGDPSRPSNAAITALKNLNVTISTVAVGAHGPAESQLLNNIATATGGKYYKVSNPRALPRIFQREARRVARPLIWDSHPVVPQIKFSHQIVDRLEEPITPLKGFVLTEKKDNPLVETLLVAPDAAGERNSTILAVWTYGLGKAAAFTSDAGARWTYDWEREPLYDELFGKLVRWSMRPVQDTGKFSVATEVEDNQLRVIVTALDKDDEFLNFLDMSGMVVGPDLKPAEMKIEQTAPGRYVGTLPAQDAGSYLINVTAMVPEKDARGDATMQAVPILTGVNVPYSDEFRDRATNDSLLGQLAGAEPRGGRPGQIIPLPEILERIEDPHKLDPEELAPELKVDTFRRDLAKATSSQDVWYYVILAGCWLFFFDVFFRRVQVSFAWLPPLMGRVTSFVLRRQPEPVRAESIERLRSRKAAVSGQLDQIRAAARFEAPAEPPAGGADTLEEELSPAPRRGTAAPPPEAELLEPQTPEEASYTERLLRAKQKVWERKHKKDRPG